MGLVFRITSQAEWAESSPRGRLIGSALDQRDGFIHCSAAHQVATTLGLYFAGRPDLILLHLDTHALAPAQLRWEPSRAGALFPHLYGDVPLSAVRACEPIALGDAGHTLPPLDDAGLYEAARDRAYMERAIALARDGVGSTGLNPSVGCVVAIGDRLLGEASTAAGGRPHAEEQAMMALEAEDLSDAVVYVTLEPCGERSSGVPSCSALLLERKPKRVVIACEDPSMYAAGTGVLRLQKAGVRVELGLCAEEAREALYRGYIARLLGR